ncbi:hypothetical protein D3C77_755470 [compost metagenome]
MMLDPGLTQAGLIAYRGQEFLRIIGVVTGNLATQFYFATALLDQLTHLNAGNVRQFLYPALHQIGQLMQHG